MEPKILVVDDEPAIVEILQANLERDGYAVVTAFDGLEALAQAEHHQPDLILLDCMLPRLDGFEVCRKLRNRTQVPILMLTARSEEIDKVLGLEIGADDYITKPFSVREVMARVRAQLRRQSFVSTDERAPRQLSFNNGELQIDLELRDVFLNGRSVNLSYREYELVQFLACNAGQVFSREDLLKHVWGYEYYGDVRTVDVTIRRAREKIEPESVNPDYKYILTRRGHGYYFVKT
ncbi:MAG: response regulator transcription factor [Clostridiaceae bacterium]|nr:response regulator transcription factor [Clostridiaceae bacterium]